MSYLRNKDKRFSYSDWIYISQAKVMFGALFNPVSGVAVRKFGLRQCQTFGSLIYSGGYILTYWSLTSGSLWASVITIAVMHGIGYGLIYPCAITTVLKWFPQRNRGFFSSIAVAGYGFGSVIWNPLETAFVNPDNVDPVSDSDDNNNAYFTDQDVLNRVPKLFVLLGCCFLVFQTLGIILQQEPNEEQFHQILSMELSEDQEKSENWDPFNVHPKQVLQTMNFWKIFISFMSTTLLSIFINSYDKAFAQKFIHDDAFFALVATLLNVFNGTSRILWGFIYDRIGYQMSVTIISCVCTAIAFSFANVALLPEDSFWSKAFYATWVCGLYAFLPGAYVAYPPTLNQLYGPKYCTHNYGLVMVSGVFNSLFLILATQFAFDVLGFIGMFYVCGIMGLAGMLSAMTFPLEFSSEDYRSRFASEERDRKKCNLNTYVMSYLRSKNKRFSYSDWIFVSQIKVLLGSLFHFTSGIMASRLGLRQCVTFGCFIYSGGYFLTYWSLKSESFWACVITIGVMHGIAYGVIYPCVVATVLKWFPRRNRGFFASIAIAGYGFGSVIWNPLETAFVNPDNVAAVPDPDDFNNTYFNDPDVLLRVPKLFLLLGGCFVALQIPGIILIQEPNKDQADGIRYLEPIEDQEKNEIKDPLDIQPKQALQTLNFWKIFISFMSLAPLSSFMNSYDKAFAQKFIHDDTFFAIVATLINIFNGSSRIVWGFLYGHMGYQMSVTIISCVSTAIAFSFANLALLPEDSLWSKAFYATWICGLYAFLPGTYVAYPPALNQLFGAKYCAHNYGIVMASNILNSLILTVTTKFGFDVLGFMGMFYICGVAGLASMAAAITFPLEFSSEDYRSRFATNENTFEVKIAKTA